MDKDSVIMERIAGQLRAEFAKGRKMKKDVAAEVGLSVGALSRYLNGHRVIPVSEFVKICNALGVDAGAILTAAQRGE